MRLSPFASSSPLPSAVAPVRFAGINQINVYAVGNAINQASANPSAFTLYLPNEVQTLINDGKIPRFEYQKIEKAVFRQDAKGVYSGFVQVVWDQLPRFTIVYLNGSAKPFYASTNDLNFANVMKLFTQAQRPAAATS